MQKRTHEVFLFSIFYGFCVSIAKFCLLTKKAILGLILLIVSLTLDRLSKNAVMAFMNESIEKSISLLPCFNITEAWNKGVSFGLFAAHQDIEVFALKLFAVTVSLFLFWLLWNSKSYLEGASYGLVIGGAFGNLWDRAVYKAVYDFLDVHAFNWHFWIFNGADVAITVGVMGLLLDSLFSHRKIASK
jgi:signal peptidase II